VPGTGRREEIGVACVEREGILVIAGKNSNCLEALL
jgi:hypothetical protein